MEREVGGGIWMGNTCKPMAVSFQCMTKSTTKKKKNYVKIREMGAGKKFPSHNQSSLSAGIGRPCSELPPRK